MEKIIYNPIGTIHTPFKDREGMPIQPSGAKDVNGEVRIYEEFQDGLSDLEGFSHIILIYHFHQSSGFSLKVTPFMDTIPRGLFATRAPRRPNPIGISVVQLESIDNGILRVKGADILDGTPLLDIKPFVSKFDAPSADRFGWLEENSRKAEFMRSDGRFSKGEPHQGSE
ncbi:MAG: tRNA (N6-threonylcarbamoyladenosine(37)-N6)-methyltransferase TrmO [Desulfovibrionales bacterium]